MGREQINIVIVGHVDHGKSTVIGRLLADTNSLPKGKLEHVKATCAKNAKPFEYAFLLDALKDEQKQGITIDTARCFFKTKKRDYIILDAPGHIEFLKNMVTGASRAEAALLVIDAEEGIQENSKRHGHMVSMLGVKQVVVLINKMDLVNYSEEIYKKIKNEYEVFLNKLNVLPINFIPLSAANGDNIARLSKNMPWYKGNIVLNQLDDFKKREVDLNLPFRFPVQDIYKFTEKGDDRRIFAGTIETGKVKVGDEVVFLPSYKESIIKSIEIFNVPKKKSTSAHESVGFTLKTQVYVKPGEIMVKKSEYFPKVSSRFKADMFWVGRAPMIKGKTYKLKLAAARANIKLVEIINVLDASDLSSVKNKQQIERHDVSECILEATKPIAFDLTTDIETTGRFVIVDNYEIAGGGIILESISDEDSILKRHIKEREYIWEKTSISPQDRIAAYHHKSKFIVFTGLPNVGKRDIAKALEKKLFKNNFKVYYLGITNIEHGLGRGISLISDSSDERIRQLGELARIMTDSGQIFITTISNADDYDIEKLKLLNEPNEILVINVGENNFNKYKVDLNLSEKEDLESAVSKVFQLLKKKEIIIEYYL